MSTSAALLAGLDVLDGPSLKARFAEARKAAVAAGATVEADAATRLLYQAMRNAIRTMAKGIDARATTPAPAAAAPAPTPRPKAPMRPVAPPRPRLPDATTAPAPAPALKLSPPTRPRSPPVMPVPPPIDPNDDFIPF